MCKLFIHRKLKFGSAIVNALFSVSMLLTPYAQAADNRVRSNNNIQLKTGTLSKSSNGTDVVDIENPNSGTSVNEFTSFDVGTNNAVILNNSKTDGQSVTGGTVSKNNKLTSTASSIVVDVQSKTLSNVNGNVEVFGSKADVLISNENGINVNGGKFINTNGVTLTTGKVKNKEITVNGKGKVTVGENGVGVDGDYFNIVSKTMEVNGDISHTDKTKRIYSINAIAGENVVDITNNHIPTVKTKSSSAGNGVAISGSALGAMNGNNIRIISTEAGVGVKHKGKINSVESLLVDAAGDIEINDATGKNIDVKGSSYRNTGKTVSTNKVTVNTTNTIDNDGELYAKDIDLTSNTVTNTGDIGAENDIKIVADTFTNKKVRTNDNGVVGSEGETVSSGGYVNYGDTAWKTWQSGLNYTSYEYNYDLTEDDFTAARVVGKNVDINTKTTNNSGIIYADDKLTIKGNVNNITLTINKTAQDVLSNMKLTGPITTSEYLGAWNTNGSSYFDKGTSILTVLKTVADSGWKNHQKEVIFNAIKDAANKDSNLKQALELLLGKNYASMQFIPHSSKWNTDAKLVFVPTKNKAGIYSKGSLSLETSKLVSGINTDITNNIALITGTYTTKSIDQGTSQLPEVIPGTDAVIPEISVDGSTDNGAAVIKANNEVVINVDDADLKVSSIISAFENVKLFVKNALTSHRSEFSGKDVEISANTITSDSDTIIASGNVKIDTKDDLNIKAGNIVAKNNIDLTSTEGNVKVEAGAKEESSFTQTITDSSSTIKTEYSKNSVGTSLIANVINIVAKETLDYIGSSVEAYNQFIAKANDVNIENSYNEYSSKTDSKSVGLNSAGILQVDTEVATTDAKLVNASKIKAGEIIVAALNKLKIKGSDLDTTSSTMLAETTESGSASGGAVTTSNPGQITLTGNTVEIADAKNDIKTFSFSTSFNPFGYADEKTEGSYLMSVGSNLNSGTNLLITSIGDTNLIGSNLTSGGLLNLTGNNVNIAAGENISSVTKTANSFGLIASASAGIGGYGAGASFNGAKGTTSTTVYDGNQNSGSVLAYAEVGVEFGHTVDVTDKTMYTNSNIKGNDVTITAAKTLDFGGANLEAEKDITLTGSDIQTTKYVDKTNTYSDGFSLYAKQTLTTSSAIAGMASTLSSNIQAGGNGKGVNGALAAASAVSSALDIMFGDVINNTSAQKVGFKYAHSASETNQEGITNITAGNNLNIKSTSGDVVLAGISANANNINLDSANDIRVRSAITTNTESGYNVSAEVGVVETGAYSAFLGARTFAGLTGSVGFSVYDSSSKTNTNSVLNAKNNMKVTSANDTIVNGGNLVADTIDLNVGNNLAVISALDTSSSTNIGMSAAGTALLGVTSNTILGGGAIANIGISAGTSSSNTVGQQSGILANNVINGDIKGDTVLVGSAIGSQTGNGNLNIGGNIYTADVSVFEKSDGAAVNVAGGRWNNQEIKFGDALVKIDDHVDKTGTMYTGINVSVNKADHSYNKDISGNVNIINNSWVGGNLDTTIITTLADRTKVKDGFKKLVNYAKGNKATGGGYDVTDFTDVNNNVISGESTSFATKIKNAVSSYFSPKNSYTVNKADNVVDVDVVSPNVDAGIDNPFKSGYYSVTDSPTSSALKGLVNNGSYDVTDGAVSSSTSSSTSAFSNAWNKIKGWFGSSDSYDLTKDNTDVIDGVVANSKTTIEGSKDSTSIIDSVKNFFKGNKGSYTVNNGTDELDGQIVSNSDTIKKSTTNTKEFVWDIDDIDPYVKNDLYKWIQDAEALEKKNGTIIEVITSSKDLDTVSTVSEVPSSIMSGTIGTKPSRSNSVTSVSSSILDGDLDVIDGVTNNAPTSSALKGLVNNGSYDVTDSKTIATTTGTSSSSSLFSKAIDKVKGWFGSSDSYDLTKGDPKKVASEVADSKTVIEAPKESTSFSNKVTSVLDSVKNFFKGNKGSYTVNQEQTDKVEVTNPYTQEDLDNWMLQARELAWKNAEVNKKIQDIDEMSDVSNFTISGDVNPYASTTISQLYDSVARTPVLDKPTEIFVYDENGNKTNIIINDAIYAVVNKNRDINNNVIGDHTLLINKNDNSATISGIAYYPNGMKINLQNEFWTTRFNKYNKVK